MLALIYHWQVLPEHEDDFTRAWTRMTEIIFERSGSLGSRLHRAEDGRFVAYAQWPSREVWDASGAIPDTSEMTQLRAIIKQSAVRILPDTIMDVLEDRLVQVHEIPAHVQKRQL